MKSALKVKWAVAICTALLAVGLACVVFPRHRPFSISGPDDRLCHTVGSWAYRHGFKAIGIKLFFLAQRLNEKHLESAVRSGRLDLVVFHDQGIGREEFNRQAFNLGKSNNWRVIMVRLKIPQTTPDSYEVILEPNGKPQMEALVRQLELVRERPKSIFE